MVADMKLNAIERAAMNNPVRAAHQHHREATWFRRLGGGNLTGQHVLEVGCGRGVGAEVILDRLGAEKVTAFDLDESMVELARRRLHGRPVSLSVGDVCAIEQPTGAIDTVVDFGIIHHVPEWQQSLAEIARVLRPGGLLLFEELPRHVLDTWAMRTFTKHPRENRFEADEFAAELARHGLHGTGTIEPHIGGALFVGAARKS
jgi:ubiquinone/menaquinone biosynthesis C-methylase UbiE